MKKIIMLAIALVCSLSAYSAPLELKCNTQYGKVEINIEALSGNGCYSDLIESAVSKNKRYDIQVCNGVFSSGFIQILDIYGNWINVVELLINKNCKTWRNISTTTSATGNISTNYSCRRSGRYRHSTRCN